MKRQSSKNIYYLNVAAIGPGANAKNYDVHILLKLFFYVYEII